MLGNLKDEAVFTNFLAGRLNRKESALKHMQAVWLTHFCKSPNSWHGENLLLCVAEPLLGMRRSKVSNSFQRSLLQLYEINLFGKILHVAWPFTGIKND